MWMFILLTAYTDNASDHDVNTTGNFVFYTIITKLNYNWNNNAFNSEIDWDGGDREELHTSHPGNITTFNIRSISACVCFISHETTFDLDSYSILCLDNNMKYISWV